MTSGAAGGAIPSRPETRSATELAAGNLVGIATSEVLM